MRGYTCDYCDNKESRLRDGEPRVELKGYYPPTLGGILIPENCQHLEFCSVPCFLKFFRPVIGKDDR